MSVITPWINDTLYTQYKLYIYGPDSHFKQRTRTINGKGFAPISLLNWGFSVYTHKVNLFMKCTELKSHWFQLLIWFFQSFLHCFFVCVFNIKLCDNISFRNSKVPNLFLLIKWILIVFKNYNILIKLLLPIPGKNELT